MIAFLTGVAWLGAAAKTTHHLFDRGGHCFTISEKMKTAARLRVADRR